MFPNQSWGQYPQSQLVIVSTFRKVHELRKLSLPTTAAAAVESFRYAVLRQSRPFSTFVRVRHTDQDERSVIVFIVLVTPLLLLRAALVAAVVSNPIRPQRLPIGRTAPQSRTP